MAIFGTLFVVGFFLHALWKMTLRPPSNQTLPPIGPTLETIRAERERLRTVWRETAARAGHAFGPPPADPALSLDTGPRGRAPRRACSTASPAHR